MPVYRGERGFTIKELTFAFVIVAGMIFLMRPLFKDLSGRTQKVNCTNNLRKLSKAICIYAKENERTFPKDLEELYKNEYISDETLLDCPSTEKKGTLQDPEYIYIPGLSADDPSGMVVLQDVKGNHPGGVNAVMVNGNTIWVEQDKDH